MVPAGDADSTDGGDDRQLPVGTVSLDPEVDTLPSADPLFERPVSVLVVVGLFVFSIGVSLAITQPIHALFDVGETGSIPRLVLGVFGFQLFGMGGAVLLYLYARPLDWRSYVRFGPLSQWTLFYGAAVGLALMVLTVGATVVFELLDLEPAEAEVGVATDPLFYLVLFVLSTCIVVPLEELFFRGILQRRLEEEFSMVFAIVLASLLFMLIHTGFVPQAEADVLTFGLFFGIGAALGLSYAVTKNLLVPIIGHAIFNGVQILVRMLEVMG